MRRPLIPVSDFYSTEEYRAYMRMVVRELQCLRSPDGRLINGPPGAPEWLAPGTVDAERVRMSHLYQQHEARTIKP